MWREIWGSENQKKKRFPVRLGSLGHVYSVGGFFLTQNGWYRKNQDWLLKKERNQRRPGCRRRWSCKVYGELLVEGPIYFAANGVRRGLAMARLKWFFIKYCKLSFLAPLLFWKICAIRIIINFIRGLRGLKWGKSSIFIWLVPEERILAAEEGTLSKKTWCRRKKMGGILSFPWV